MAVRELQNVTLDPSDPLSHSTPSQASRKIQITTRKVATSYSTILNTVPGFHTRPPTLPTPITQDDDRGEYDLDDTYWIPKDGYDIVMHVGTGLNGNMHVEHLGHKSGYLMADADGEYAPIIGEAEASGAAKRAQKQTNVRSPRKVRETKNRGFGTGYEEYPEILKTDIDVPALISKLHEGGITVSAVHHYRHRIKTQLKIIRKSREQ